MVGAVWLAVGPDPRTPPPLDNYLEGRTTMRRSHRDRDNEFTRRHRRPACTRSPARNAHRNHQAGTGGEASIPDAITTAAGTVMTDDVPSGRLNPQTRRPIARECLLRLVLLFYLPPPERPPTGP